MAKPLLPLHLPVTLALEFRGAQYTHAGIQEHSYILNVLSTFIIHISPIGAFGTTRVSIPIPTYLLHHLAFHWFFAHPWHFPFF